MNTTQIGDEFENKVFQIFNEELLQHRLLITPENSNIYKKKGYYSRDRESDIIVDISIETFIPNLNNYSLLTVIECKKYNHSVPVDDVEEFYSKLRQISGANAKGIMVSSNTFQKGALKFAQSNGIALVRILEEDKLHWILPRALTGYITYEQIEESRRNIYNGLTDEDFKSDYIDFYGLLNNHYTSSLKQLFEFLLKDELPTYEDNHANQSIQSRNFKKTVPFIERKEIEATCEEILKSVGYKEGEVPIYQVCNSLETTQKISFIFSEELGSDSRGFKVLGKITFNPITIYIANQANENQYRKKFTLAHELGHYFLNHSQFMYREIFSENDSEENNLNLIGLEDVKRLEWQANYFASNLLLPKDKFIEEFNQLLYKEEIKDRGHGALFVDNTPWNVNNFFKITDSLMEKFQVSRKVIEIRLKQLNLLNDQRNNFDMKINLRRF
ncbi:MAG TPA: ImmA/IrrE family metallo-endopeptidase [Patescibacteria group bacterium]|nr:ImmA/IrrE family metallo-endopeptidase [Patescibacteria group bacterium]